MSAAPAELSVGGAFTQLAEGALEVHLGPGGTGRLSVAGKVTLAGGKLTVKFSPGYSPVIGGVIDVIMSGSRQGRFSTVEVDGHAVTPVYSNTGVRLLIDS